MSHNAEIEVHRELEHPEVTVEQDVRRSQPRSRPREVPPPHYWQTRLQTQPNVAEMVEQFHLTFGVPLRRTPTMSVPADEMSLRVGLLEEELCEFEDAVENGDLVALADALADLAYVLYGTALTFGVDLDSAVAEVHRSNMSKLGPDGVPILREDGKVLKGPNFKAPDIAGVLDI